MQGNMKNKIIPITFNGSPYAVIIENPTVMQRIYCAISRII